MYRILIVDDEKIERDGIRQMLKRAGIELEIQEASNGREASACLEQNRVDILLTDIRMPVVDGMELLKQVCPRYPEMKSIIFSGCGRFEYAKEAMKLGVRDYLLKPVKPEELAATIRSLIRELDEQMLSKNREAETDTFMKEHILYSLVNGAKAEEVEKKRRDYFDAEEINRYQRMILLEVNDDFFGRMGTEIEPILTGVLQEDCKYLNLNEQQSILFLEERREWDYTKIAEDLVDAVKKRYNERCFAAIGGCMEHPAQEIGRCFEVLEECMERKFFETEYRIFMASERVDGGMPAQMDDDALVKQMKQDIKMKDIDSLRQHFEVMCDKYGQNNSFSQIYIKFVFSNLLKDFYENLPSGKGQSLEREIERLYNATEFSMIREVVNHSIERLGKEFESYPQIVHKEIESVKKYIYENYDKEISVDHLADMVCMAPSYLSHVFKKETGQNLSKFIKNYRMEKAKEMLDETHHKIVQISYAVGYSNVSYFCQSFREYFGVSPQRYRDQGDQIDL
ncbi:MAG: response regulator [Lachnospiraceae bacterium]|nr:response regulator [Lachnospiraceae bacterium]